MSSREFSWLPTWDEALFSVKTFLAGMLALYIAVSIDLSRPYWAPATAAMGLARPWRDQSKRTEARDLLAPIYGWFTEGFDTPVLKDAKALFDELA